MRALVTGADGFIGKNLCVWLSERGYQVSKYVRGTISDELTELIFDADVVFHLAGANRPELRQQFESDNELLTEKICRELANQFLAGKAKKPLIFASSVAVELDSHYGQSKLAAEKVIKNYVQKSVIKAQILRLPNIFGKGCRPNYNSVVATFCAQAINKKSLSLSNPEKVLRLLHIDDLLGQMVRGSENFFKGGVDLEIVEFDACFEISVGELARKISSFDLQRRSDTFGNVGKGFDRALFSTYISHLGPDEFISDLTAKVDSRGSFVEFLKTAESGQVSVMKCLPGEIRGRHFHNTKSERFLLVQGSMKVEFENVFSGQREVRLLSAANNQVVWAVPGWSHSFENVGTIEAIVVVWANEIFDFADPDTYRYPKDESNG